MLDPNYNPYDELEIAKHNINELIKAINHYSELLKELGQQHMTIVSVNHDLHRRLRSLELEVKTLKQTRSSPAQ